MKKLTKKQALSLIEKKWRHIKTDDFIIGLCNSLPLSLSDDWDKYWAKINTTDMMFISNEYYNMEDKRTLSTLARLLILHHFIEDTYK